VLSVNKTLGHARIRPSGNISAGKKPPQVLSGLSKANGSGMWKLKLDQ